MQAKPAFLSRKIWVVIIDALATIAVTWLSLIYADKPGILEAMVTTVGAFQVMAVALISGIVAEDNNRRDNETQRISDEQYAELEKTQAGND